MAETITISISASVKSGPELRATWSAVLPSYEKMELHIDAGQTASLPLSSVDEISLLVLSVGSSDGPVSYKFAAAPPPASGQQASNQQPSGQPAADQHAQGQPAAPA